MTPAEVRARYEAIVAVRGDAENAHSMEDDLHQAVLLAIANGNCASPAECARLALMTQDIDFSRWFA